MANCRMMAWAWGAGEPSCWSGFKKKLRHAGDSMKMCSQNGETETENRNMLRSRFGIATRGDADLSREKRGSGAKTAVVKLSSTKDFFYAEKTLIIMLVALDDIQSYQCFKVHL